MASSVSLKYSKNKSNRKGTEYELKLLIFFLKRAVEKQSEFILARERSCDVKFDDIYLRIDDIESEYYVQAKHRDDETKIITYEDLTSLSNTDFKLLKYFDSYLEIMKREKEISSKNLKFLISSTIYLNHKELKLKGINVVEINNVDGIIKTGDDSQIGCCYKLEILDSEVMKEIFKGAYSNLRKLCRKLMEVFFQGKKINIGQIPILRSYHVALVKEILDNSDGKTVKFTDKVIENSEELSPEAKEFRHMLFESAKELLMEMNEKLQNGNHKESEKFKAILENYENVLNNGIFDDSASNVFWEKMKMVKLPVVGQFGTFDLKSEKQLQKFIDELVDVINMPLEKTLVIDQKAELKKYIFKLLGYVFIVKDDHIRFNEEFCRNEQLNGSLEQIRNLLKEKLGNKMFQELDSYQLNIDFSSKDHDKLFKDKVYWNLVEDRLEDLIIVQEPKEFLDRLIFLVTPKEDDLGLLIRNEMKAEFGKMEGDIIYDALQSRMIDWTKCRDESGRGKCLTRDDNPYVETIKKHPQSVMFNVSPPVPSFTGREKDLTEIHKMLQCREGNTVIIAQNVVVSGMGGIGKTELARKYAEIYKGHYNGNVVWIDAKVSSVSNSFITFADWLKIDIKQPDGSERDIRNIVREVYKYFAQKKSLFIFDDVEEYNDIKSYFPNVGVDSKKPYILITSRNRDLFKSEEHGNIEKWDLGLFSEEEAVQFVEKTVKLEEKSGDNTKELVKLMGCLPLALKHAVAYINQSQKDIGAYVKLYKMSENEAKSLLNGDELNSFSKTIFLTFKMAAEKVRQMKPNGKVAIEILNALAYLFPENIPKNMFLQMAVSNIEDDDDEEDDLKMERAEMLLSRSIKLLQQYSLIDVNIKTQTLNIHQLVQYVIRLWLYDVDKQMITLEKNKTDDNLGEIGTLKIAMKLLYNYKMEQAKSDNMKSFWSRVCSKYGKVIDEYYNDFVKSGKSSMYFLTKIGKLSEIQEIVSHVKTEHRVELTNFIALRNVVISSEDRWSHWSNLISLWGYACKYGDLIDEFYKIPMDYERTPLHFLCKNGSGKEIKLIMKYLKSKHRGEPEMFSKIRDGIINVADRWKNTPLHWAIINNQLDVVKILVSNGADINIKTTSKETPLYIAAERGHTDIVQYLINEGKAVSGEDFAAEHIATYYGNSDVIRILTKQCEPLKRAKYMLHSKLNSKIGCSCEDIAEVFKGLDDNESKELVNSELYGRVPVNVASDKGYTDIVEYLITKGAVIERNGFTPLHRASQEGHLNMVKLLVSHGSDPKDVFGNGRTSLHYAAEWGRLDVVKYFIDDLQGDKSIDVNVVDGQEDTPLDKAAYAGKLDVVKFLLMRKAIISPDDYDTYEWDIRSYMFEKVNDFIKHLLKDVKETKSYMGLECKNILSNRELTALNISAALGEIRNVKKLIKEEPLDLKDIRTSMQFAEIYNNSEVFEFLCRFYIEQTRNTRNIPNNSEDNYSEKQNLILSLVSKLLSLIFLLIIIYVYFY